MLLSQVDSDNLVQRCPEGIQKPVSSSQEDADWTWRPRRRTGRIEQVAPAMTNHLSDQLWSHGCVCRFVAFIGLSVSTKYAVSREYSAPGNHTRTSCCSHERSGIMEPDQRSAESDQRSFTNASIPNPLRMSSSRQLRYTTVRHLDPERARMNAIAFM